MHRQQGRSPQKRSDRDWRHYLRVRAYLLSLHHRLHVYLSDPPPPAPGISRSPSLTRRMLSGTIRGLTTSSGNPRTEPQRSSSWLLTYLSQPAPYSPSLPATTWRQTSLSPPTLLQQRHRWLVAYLSGLLSPPMPLRRSRHEPLPLPLSLAN